MTFHLDWALELSVCGAIYLKSASLHLTQSVCLSVGYLIHTNTTSGRAELKPLLTAEINVEFILSSLCQWTRCCHPEHPLTSMVFIIITWWYFLPLSKTIYRQVHKANSFSWCNGYNLSVIAAGIQVKLFILCGVTDIKMAERINIAITLRSLPDQTEE